MSDAGAALSLQKLQAGDREEFARLVDAHSARIYRLGLRMLGNAQDAEEVMQNTFMNAMLNISRFEGRSSIETWLHRIAANEALMRRRRNVRRSEVIPLRDDGESLMDELPGEDAATPEREVLGSEVRRLLERQVDALPDLYRAVFVLRAIEEMSVEETAAALDLPAATVRVRYFRARALLRTALERRVDDSLREAFAFDGERCDRIVAGVLGALSPSLGRG